MTRTKTMTAHSALMALLAALTTTMTLFLLSFSSMAAAFSNNEFSSSLPVPWRRQLRDNYGGDACLRFHAGSFPSSTALFYKDLEGSSTDTADETQQQQQHQQEEIFLRSSKHNTNNNKLLDNNLNIKKQRTTESYTASTTTTTTTNQLNTAAAMKKNRKNKLKNKKRSYTLHKQSKGGGSSGVIPATPEELANHVQSIFSDLIEYEGDDDDDNLEEHNLNHPHMHHHHHHHHVNDNKGIMKQNSILLDNHPSLVLNANYQPLRMLPLSTWSWQSTVKAVLSGKAVVVDIYPDLFVRAVSLDIPVPSVIALREFAPTGKARPAFTRRNVFLRDGYRCQYCSNLFRTSDLSLDHVTPRCLGGKLTWDNTVTCCRKCNGRKGSLLPTQLHMVGMELRTEPRCPSLYELAAEASRFVPRRVHPTWEPFLGGGNGKMEDI